MRKLISVLLAVVLLSGVCCASVAEEQKLKSAFRKGAYSYLDTDDEKSLRENTGRILLASFKNDNLRKALDMLDISPSKDDIDEASELLYIGSRLVKAMNGEGLDREVFAEADRYVFSEIIKRISRLIDNSVDYLPFMNALLLHSKEQVDTDMDIEVDVANYLDRMLFLEGGNASLKDFSAKDYLLLYVIYLLFDAMVYDNELQEAGPEVVSDQDALFSFACLWLAHEQ